ncbi:type I-A CRISPR-associated protein Cas4/Csa1 [Infirmifilum sp. NZ]|uniref:type I-A CRISPR-associated protein Cas4/Csa1 n=1 Tax=Infirmifilum sp. NZ TaxID=2926850 RepID=UPI0027A809AE|nr:type I-A CRISPR-associated protein Cas4/Csa1 [Infirmifilum sp. NZ]UNQ73772.1 type I-A CRISPR-associated protein Cas4/Csa1 [Infirmifilum sp. NZ]
MFPWTVWGKVRGVVAGDLVVELRGWRLEQVGARHGFMPTVSEVSSPCPTKRDAYLRRVRGLRPQGDGVLQVGRLLHEAFLEPFRLALRGRVSVEEASRAKARLLRGAPRDLRAAASRVFDEAFALASAWGVGGARLPVAVEPELPGSLVGLSDTVRPDLLVGGVPVDFVTGNGLERKELAVTAYALAVEALTSNPVNYGVVAQFAGGRITWRTVVLDDSVRGRFLEARDYVARVVESREDPGVADDCPEWCPWRAVCHAALRV